MAGSPPPHLCLAAMVYGLSGGDAWRVVDYEYDYAAARILARHGIGGLV